MLYDFSLFSDRPIYETFVLGEWLERTPREKFADEVVRLYDERCDGYDRLVCPPDGMPRCGGDLGRINRNAREVRNELLTKVKLGGLEIDYPLTSQEFQTALWRYRRKRG